MILNKAFIGGVNISYAKPIHHDLNKEKHHNCLLGKDEVISALVHQRHNVEQTNLKGGQHCEQIQRNSYPGNKYNFMLHNFFVSVILESNILE